MSKNLPKINHNTVIFTNHAKERMTLRKINQDMIITVMRSNTTKIFEQDDGKVKFVGKSMGAKVQAVCKPIPEENKWLVISVWVRGENDDGTFVNNKYSNVDKNSISPTVINIVVVIAIIAVLVVFYLIIVANR